MTTPPGNPAPGWYPDPAGGGSYRYWDGIKWTDAATPGARSGWLTGKPKWLVAALVVIAVIALVLIARGLGSEGKSASYEWGLRRGDNAVSLVRSGMGSEAACREMITAGHVFADNPMMNPDPPPKPLTYQDAMSGCLDQIRNKLGS